MLLLFAVATYGQRGRYTTANAHSHNDYEQASPFWAAWKQGFGSIEADIFLVDGELIVAHDKQQLSNRRTLDSLYLAPLQQCLLEHKSYVYADTNRGLQLMIDIKSEALPTLDKLVEKLGKYSSLINAGSLKIAISGSRPPASQFNLFPVWIRFDGELQKEYTEEEFKKIEMLSDNFARYSQWKGEGALPEKDRVILTGLINKAHSLGKKIRFWNAPDNINSWNVLVSLGVDYINTDNINGFAEYFK